MRTMNWLYAVAVAVMIMLACNPDACAEWTKNGPSWSYGTPTITKTPANCPANNATRGTGPDNGQIRASTWIDTPSQCKDPTHSSHFAKAQMTSMSSWSCSTDNQEEDLPTGADLQMEGTGEWETVSTFPGTGQSGASRFCWLEDITTTTGQHGHAGNGSAESEEWDMQAADPSVGATFGAGSSLLVWAEASAGPKSNMGVGKGGHEFEVTDELLDIASEE